MALSLNHPPTYPSPEDIWPFDIAAKAAIPIIDQVLSRLSDPHEKTFLGSTVLNVNFPNVKSVSEIKGTRITQQGCSRFIEHFNETTVSQGTRRCFMLTGEMSVLDTSMEYDTYAIGQGYVAITPLGLRCDLRGGPEVAKFESWFTKK